MLPIAPNRPALAGTRSRFVLRLTLAAVLGIGGLLFALHGAGAPALGPVPGRAMALLVGGTEALGAALFVPRRTGVLGAVLLLVSFVGAAVLHIMLGEGFPEPLVVYGVAVLALVPASEEG